MSVEAASGKGVESIPLFDGEIGYKDRLNEKITGFANRVIQVNSYLKQCCLLAFMPFHSGEYGQTHYEFQEVARRVTRFILAFPAWLGTLPFATVGTVAAAVGNYLHSRAYRTTCGTFHGDVHKNPKLFLLNPRMLTGTSPLREAGLSLGNDRWDRLIATVWDNNPDVVFLPEVNRFTASSLTEVLKERYHFFFTGMGEKAYGEDVSFFIAFRGDLVRPPEYIPFTSQDWMMERGYFVMETNDRIYVCTYNPVQSDLEEICARDFGDKKVAIMGEMDRDLKEVLIEKGFVSGIPEEAELTTLAPYAYFHKQEEEEPDIKEEPFLFFKGIQGKTDVVPMHDVKKINEALSDHALILHR